MKRIPLGSSGLQVPTIALGMMRIAEKSDDEIRALFHAARSQGIDFFDHADIYGGAHACERRFGEALQLAPSERSEVVIQTKAGIVPSGPYYDLSYEHIVRSAEESLRALRTDYIDLFLLHRPDPLVEPDEVARAFDHLAERGMVRAFGVSNHTPRQIELLAGAVRQPIVVNQLQLSLLHARIVAQGITSNTDDAEADTNDGGGVLDHCRVHDVTVQAWGPLQGPHGVFLGSNAHPQLNDAIARLAQKYDVAPAAIATAWIARHPARMQVILGTTSPTRIADTAPGGELTLQRDEWYELYRSAGHSIP